MKQLPKLLLVITLFLALCSGICVAPEAPRPNIAFVITDDQGHGDLGHLRTTASEGDL